ncbi:MAG: hypothetical protein SGJ01_19190 [Gemmatimonadota bacterium]|nr:hypothetical protein [Gemmatimonadota bacterium]
MTPDRSLAAQRRLDAFLAAPGPRTLESVVRWIAIDGATTDDARTARLQLLARTLDSHPRRVDLEKEISAVWTSGSAVQLLAEMGLPLHQTLVKEIVERVVDRLVPRRASDTGLSILLTRLPVDEATAGWVESLPDDVLAPWRSLLGLPEKALRDAATLLALRTAAVGLARDMLDLEPELLESSSPFFQLAGTVALVAQHPRDSAHWEHWVHCRAEVYVALDRGRERLDVHGVSTDLIYRFELLEAQLARLDLLLGVASGRVEARRLAGALIRGRANQFAIRLLGRNALKRLARKVVEHTGESGDHYVVRTGADWRSIERSAALGGVLTAFTAVGKYVIGALPLAPMFAGLAYTFNYTGSFIAMQLLHLTLASKQPAMTAAALAHALEHQGDVEEQVELVAGITRSQVIATLGNVFATIPVTLLLVAFWFGLTGRPALGPETAEHTLHGMHPFLSWTIPFAALTGVFLWISSLAAGWASNWSTYRGLPVAIAEHPGLRRTVGERRAAWWGAFVERNLGGIAGYTVLGFLLGFVPVLFKFAGVALEVRHVTLHAASLALSAGSLFIIGAGQLQWQAVVWGALGIVIIGSLNFSVSFTLALRTAMRARDLGQRERRRLWAALRKAFREQPRRFLARPRDR